MTRMTAVAHLIVGSTLEVGDWAIDATVGNGHDVMFLLAAVGARGRVFGFDIQARAIASTSALVDERALLFRTSHADMAKCLPPDAAGRIGAVMFNLGYLPGGDKTIVTQPHSTLAALAQGLPLLRPGGVLSIMVYPAHAGGQEEATAILDWAAALDDRHTVTHHTTLRPGHLPPGPFLLVIRRRG